MSASSEHSLDRVLVVDDEPAIRRAYQRLLSSAGYVVDVADGGVEATSKLGTHAYSAIVSDISMPGMGGIEMLGAIREHHADIPVIFVTGAPTTGTAVAAVNGGAFRYLSKPLDSGDLEEQVRRAVQQHRVTLARRQALAELDLPEEETGIPGDAGVGFERALSSLWLAFQPIVRARGGELFAYEALLRSREPSLPGPGDVLGAAERNGQLATLGRKIRATAAAQFRSAQPDCDLFVNLHPADLADDDLLNAAAPLTAVAHRVVLEVTERAMLDSVPEWIERLAVLRQMGFRLAIDDLGAGYSGLMAFVQLEPEVVKLDMSLIRGIEASPVKQRLAGSLVQVCRDLGILVVAEGIETADERDTVIGLGCDLLQGYLLGRPGWPIPAAPAEASAA